MHTYTHTLHYILTLMKLYNYLSISTHIPTCPSPTGRNFFLFIYFGRTSRLNSIVQEVNKIVYHKISAARIVTSIDDYALKNKKVLLFILWSRQRLS